MDTAPFIKYGYFVMKILHLHPDQEFNKCYYTIRIIWYITSIIVSIMVTLNYLNHDITADGLRENVTMTLFLMQVSLNLKRINKYVILM